MGSTISRRGLYLFQAPTKGRRNQRSKVLTNVIDYHYQKEINITASDPEIAPPVPWLIYYQEWYAMPWECPFEDTLWNQLLSGS
jgi:hypothetical protein